MKLNISLISAVIAFSLLTAPPAHAKRPRAVPASPQGANEAQKNTGKKEAPAEVRIEPRKEVRITIGEAFVQEELKYTISVLFIDEAAAGEVSLVKGTDGDYIATLTAYTTGIIDKLYHRKDVYVSRLKPVDGGRRFVTRSFEKTMDINGRIRNSVTVMDYDKKLMTWASWGGGKDEKSGEVKLPPGNYYDDPLGAFYNFRFGAYGPPKEGGEYKILTFPKEDRVPEIYMRLVPKEEKEKRLTPENKKTDADYLADVKIDRELFAAGSGDVEILFNDSLIPVEAVAKGIAFFGDVRGTLKEIGVAIEFNTPPPTPATIE